MATRRVAIVDPIRTPVGKFAGALAPVSAGDLAAPVMRAVVERTAIEPGRIDDVVFAQCYANGEAPCIGRWAGLPPICRCSVPGMQARPALRRRACRRDRRPR